VAVTPAVAVRVDLLKAQFQICPALTKLSLEPVVTAHQRLQIMSPPLHHLQKVETPLLPELMFQLPQPAVDLAQGEVNQLIWMVVPVVEAMPTSTWLIQEQETYRALPPHKETMAEGELVGKD
jgi:hypothetical protein